MLKPVVTPLNKSMERIAPSEREEARREPQVDLLARQSLSKPEQDIHCGNRQAGTSKKLMIGNAKKNAFGLSKHLH